MDRTSCSCGNDKPYGQDKCCECIDYSKKSSRKAIKMTKCSECEKMREALEWKETVRQIYDDMHFGDKTVFNDPVSRAVVKTIEERHREYFLEGTKT